MGTTLRIDSEILSAARQIVAATSKSIGKVISELARRGLQGDTKCSTDQGYPVFPVSLDAPPLTPDDVRQAQDEL
jgi:hypothetical protein